MDNLRNEGRTSVIEGFAFATFLLTVGPSHPWDACVVFGRPVKKLFRINPAGYERR